MSPIQPLFFRQTSKQSYDRDGNAVPADHHATRCVLVNALADGRDACLFVNPREAHEPSCNRHPTAENIRRNA